MSAAMATPESLLIRNQAVARRVVNEAYPFHCCAVCGLQVATCLHIAHLDHRSGNNAPDNLARLCPTHHWMFDAGLYPVEAIRMLQVHWQKTRGTPDHKGRMKDAGAKAAVTR
jgi:predicted restriction endonuclease